MAYSVYVLKDPRVEGVEGVRYVGATQMPLYDRLELHLLDAKRNKGNSPRCRWLRRLYEEGITPKIEEVERLIPNQSEAGDRENFWMDHFRALGCKLLNVRRGGGGLSDNKRGGPSIWAICKFEKMPDRYIAEHEGVSTVAVGQWRKKYGHAPYMSYSEHQELFSSLCPEVAAVTSVWGGIVKERMQLETYGVPGCSVYEDWISRLEEVIELTQDVELLREEGLEEVIAAYCRSLLEMLKSDMSFTGHESLLRLFKLWDRIEGERRLREGKVTLDDLDVWISWLVMHKRSVVSDVFQYDRVISVHDRYIGKLRKERKRYE